MEANILIISDNNVSIDFWSNIIQKDLAGNVLIGKTSSLEGLHHFISSYTIVIIDDYFTAPDKDKYIIERAQKVRQINPTCKIFAVSPVYLDENIRERNLILPIERNVFCNDFIASMNNEIANSINTLNRLAV